MYKYLICSLALFSHIAFAESTIERIKRTKTVNVGYITGNFPISYANNHGEVAGFSVDLTKEIVANLSKDLGMKEPLNIEVKPMTLSNRFDMMQRGEIDLSCSSHSNLPERKQLVNFSYNFFVARGRLMVRTDSGIENYKQLEGKTIAVLKDAAATDALNKKRFQFKFNEPVLVNNSEEGFKLLREGVVDGFVDDDILMAGFIAKNHETDKFHMIGRSLTLDNYACLLPKGDKEMKELVDKSLFYIFTSKKIDELFKRWFQEEIPELGINLQFEMNQSIKSLYSAPNDKAIGEP